MMYREINRYMKDLVCYLSDLFFFVFSQYGLFTFPLARLTLEASGEKSPNILIIEI